MSLAGSAAAQTVTPFATGLNSLRGVAVDSSNNVLVNEVFTGQTLRIPAGGGVPTAYATTGSPEGVTVAVTGDVFISGSDVYRSTAANVGSIYASPPAYSLGMDIDSGGQLYAIVGDEIHLVTPGATTPLVTVGLSEPYGLAIGPSDLVLVSDQTLNQIFRINGDGSLTLYADFNGVGRTPVGLVFRGAELYVVVRQGEVWRVGALGEAPSLFAPLGALGTSFDIAVQPDGAALYVTWDSGDIERVSLPPLPAPAAVPTLSEWAMILLGLAMAGGAALILQRRVAR